MVARNLTGRIAYRMQLAKRAWHAGGMAALARFTARRVFDDAAGVIHRIGVYLRSRDGFVEIECEVGKMYVSAQDPGISRQLLKSRTREKELVQLLGEEVAPGMVGLDIGANIGYFAVLESALVGPQGRIYAVEPVPDNLRVLQKNALQRPNIEIVSCAAASHDGEATIHTTGASNLASLLGSDRGELTDEARAARVDWRPLTVRLATIDTIMVERRISKVDFVRMDIEGYEFDATEGMNNLLSRRDAPLKLFVEVHNMLLSDVQATVSPWLNKLMSYGLKPRAIATDGRIDRDVDKARFIEKVCGFKRSCPHILMVRE